MKKPPESRRHTRPTPKRPSNASRRSISPAGGPFRPCSGHSLQKTAAKLFGCVRFPVYRENHPFGVWRTAARTQKMKYALTLLAVLLIASDRLLGFLNEIVLEGKGGQTGGIGEVTDWMVGPGVTDSDRCWDSV